MGLFENVKARSMNGAMPVPARERGLLTPTPGVKSTSQYCEPFWRTRTARVDPLYGSDTS